MIYTGSYKNCKSGNLISISGDRGKKVGYTGKALPALAPKRAFWKVWESNIGKIDEYENTYGPLLLDGLTGRENDFTWVNRPWPWEVWK